MTTTDFRDYALPAPAYDDVWLSYRPHPNRATNVPIEIEHADGTHVANVNQRKAPPIRGNFVSLGRFHFTSGKPAIVTVSNGDTDGYVVIDSLQLTPAEFD